MFNFCSVIGRHSCDSSSPRTVIVEGHNVIPHNFSVFLKLQLFTVWSALWHCISIHSILYIIMSDKEHIMSYNINSITSPVVYLLLEEKKPHLIFFSGKKMVSSVYISRLVHFTKTCWWGWHALGLHPFCSPREIILPPKQPHCKQSFPISEAGLQFVLLYPSAQSGVFNPLSWDSEILLQNWKPGIRSEVYC